MKADNAADMPLPPPLRPLRPLSPLRPLNAPELYDDSADIRPLLPPYDDNADAPRPPSTGLLDIAPPATPLALLATAGERAEARASVHSKMPTPTNISTKMASMP